jgi:predicted NAD/FAD-binding protein
VRASWNYRLLHDGAAPAGPVVTYYLNRLQRLGVAEHYCVSLNQTASIRPERIIARIPDRHPLYTAESVTAQARLPALDGVRRTWFCGAYHGYGFHEDGLAAGLRVAERIEARA